MTKRIVAVLALSLVSADAFASQAKNLISGGGDRGLILGTTGMYGSFYTNDEYNMFWNPAFINGQKSWAIIENGANSGTGNNATSGGFVTGMGALNVGVFFNRATNSVVNTNGTQNIDLVVGGDMGVKWGLGLSTTLSTGSASTTTLKGGVMVADFEPFVAFDLKNSTGTVSSSDMTIGTRYHMGDWTPYVAYRSVKTNTNNANAQTHMGLGFGRSAKMGDVDMSYSVAYWSVKTPADDTTYTLPVDLTFAAPASSWFTARVGFSHDLRASTARAQATNTRIGGTFHLGKADLDMVVGNNSDNAFGFDDELFANAGLTYRM